MDVPDESSRPPGLEPILEALARDGRMAVAGAERLAGSASVLRAALASWSASGLPIELDQAWLCWRPRCEVLDADRIAAAMAARGWSMPVRVSLATDSTNSRLLAAGAAGLSAPRLHFAELQSQGRGRRQRRWQAGFGQALQWSALLANERPVAQLPGLAIVVGVALVQALHDIGLTDVGLKWPNDLVAAEAKLGGVLVEAVTAATRPAKVVVGIGINQDRPEIGDASGGRVVTCLSELAARRRLPLPGRSELAVGLAAAVLAGADRFRVEGLAPFLPLYARFDSLAGREVGFEQAGRHDHGRALGLAEDGALRVRTRSGECRLYSANVSVSAA